MADRLFIIDGHALIFKMYYAFLRKPMINSKGADMSILYGFTKFILELMDREKPTHFAVAFDPPGGTFRNKMYPEYKANRAETPQLVIDALEPLTALCGALKIPVLMEMGYEADDVIGTIAKRLGSEKMDVFMVTPDKDYGQLIGSHVFQLKPGKAGGDDELLDSAKVCEKYGIQRPEQVIDILTICGDTADNVPGVKGVGEKGASKLISQYGSVENIYAHLDELSPRQKVMFEEAEPHIGLSHELVTIKTDVPVEADPEKMRVDTDYSPEIADLFEKYEFNSLKKYIGHVSAPKPEAKKGPQISLADPQEVTSEAGKTGAAAIIAEGSEPGIFAQVKRVTVCVKTGETTCMAAEGSAEDFKKLIEEPSITKYGFSLKLQESILLHAGFRLRGKYMDLGLMHYLLDPERSHEPQVLAKAYLGMDINEDEGEGEAELSLFDEPGPEKESHRFMEAAAISLMGEKIWKDMEKKGVTFLYEKMEEPLVRVLAKMERNGVKVDLASLEDFALELRKEMEERQERIRLMAGEPGLNVSSPRQIGQVIFEKLKLDPKAKKTSGGSWSTDENTLVKLADRSPIIDEILEFRAVKKLLSTYIEPFPAYVSKVDGRIHTTFNQALTATGRLSSSNPNLQNIPVRSERGKEIRKAFVPANPDGLILSADYSQIELRIMAHMSGDEHLLTSFRNGMDIHAATASKIFGIPHEEVTQDQRRIAKTANFGIMYGISSFGLAERLRISRSEAKKLIEDYFAAFPSIRDFIEAEKDFARKNGYVETLFHRRRYLPDINARNVTQRQLAERNAVNAPIQGTAADIIKLAMIGTAKKMEEEGFKSKMVLQIHDELVFDTLPEEAEALKALVKDQMENVISLSVPLTVECNYGKNWLEAH